MSNLDSSGSSDKIDARVFRAVQAHQESCPVKAIVERIESKLDKLIEGQAALVTRVSVLEIKVGEIGTDRHVKKKEVVSNSSSSGKFSLERDRVGWIVVAVVGGVVAVIAGGLGNFIIGGGLVK
jgi:hypothetical protein